MAPDPQRVFVIHGRNTTARDELGAFLFACGLKPLNFTDLRTELGGTPTIDQVIEAGMERAQGVIALITPDESTSLRPELRTALEDKATATRWQPRPNVLFEAGMAFARDRNRLAFVVFGDAQLPSDLTGVHALRPTDDAKGDRHVLREVLRDGMKCAVVDSRDWMFQGKFERDVRSEPLAPDPFEAAKSAQGHGSRGRVTFAVSLGALLLGAASATAFSHVRHGTAPAPSAIPFTCPGGAQTGKDPSQVPSDEWVRVDFPEVPRDEVRASGSTAVGFFIFTKKGTGYQTNWNLNEPPSFSAPTSLGFPISEETTFASGSSGYFAVSDSGAVHFFGQEPNVSAFEIRPPVGFVAARDRLYILGSGSNDLTGLWVAPHSAKLLRSSESPWKVVNEFSSDTIAFPNTRRKLGFTRQSAFLLGERDKHRVLVELHPRADEPNEQPAPSSANPETNLVRDESAVPDLRCATALVLSAANRPVLGLSGREGDCEPGIVELTGTTPGFRVQFNSDGPLDVTGITANIRDFLVQARTQDGTTLFNVDSERKVEAVDEFRGQDIVYADDCGWSEVLVVTKTGQAYASFIFRRPYKRP